MALTTDPNDPRLHRGGIDTAPTKQHDVYLVLSPEEIGKGFVRPVRQQYQHVGPPKPQYELRDLTDEEHQRYDRYGYVKFEVYPESEAPRTGRFWTQQDLNKKGCGAVTAMGRQLAETYARDPKFYGATYCVGCQMHLPVEEFVWDGTSERVGS